MIDRIGPVEAASAAASVDATVRRTDHIDEGRTSGISVTAADLDLLETLRADVATGDWLDTASATMPTVVLGDTAARRLGIGATGVRVWLGDQWFTVIGILAQRLGRKIDSDNKEPYEVKAIDLRRFGFPVTDPDEAITLYRGVPAEANRMTGYKGRMGIHELLRMNAEIAELVVRRAALADLKEAAKANGMKELREDGLEKVLAGVTTPDEVMRVVFTAGY